MSKLSRIALLSALIAAAGCTPPVADDDVGSSADNLTQVAAFGSNPGGLKMYTYVPADLPQNAPVVLAMHGCSQAASDYVAAGWNKLADQWKFIVVYPEQTTGNNPARCFRWYDAAQMTRGQGEVESVKQMVDYVKSHYSVDPGRVFATGLSGGAALTVALLATYPDVFAAGAPMAGLPYGCAASVNDAFTCMSGVDKAPSAWGDLVRAKMPKNPPRVPRISIWQGASDALVKPTNQAELVEQWTNVQATDAAADVSETVSGATHKAYKDLAGNVVVETYTVPGMGHGTAVDPGFAPAGGCGTTGSYVLDANICSSYYAGVFFDLDTADGGGGGGAGAGGAGAGGAGAGGAGAGGAGAGGSGGSGAGGSGGSGAGGSGGSGAGGSGGSGGSGGGPVACQDFYEANYYHVVHGHATQCGSFNSYVCAKGSGAQFGLYNLTKSWLRMTAPGYYEVGQCQ